MKEHLVQVTSSVGQEEEPDDCEGPIRPTRVDDWQHVEVPVEHLLRTLEDELIPRLLVAHTPRAPVETTSPVDVSQIPWASPACIRQLSSLCIEQDSTAVNALVKDLLARGVTLESIYLKLVAPAARELGERWNTDEASFADVSLGLCCLHRLLCDCESVGFHEAATPESHSILLTSTPGDQHTFGVAMAADFFRRYGWQVSNLCGLESGFVIERLRSVSYSVLGLSMHSDQHIETLDRVIGQARRVSCNPDLLIIVGGDYFLRHPLMVKHVGADLLATDGHKAILDARAALRLRSATA